MAISFYLRNRYYDNLTMFYGGFFNMQNGFLYNRNVAQS